MTKNLFVAAGALAVLVLAAGAVACSSGGGGDGKTPTPNATEATVTLDKAKLSGDIASLRTVLDATIAKANAGDVQGTRDAEGKGDTAIEEIIKMVRSEDPALADSIETLELDYEKQADSDNPDLAVIAADAQQVLDLLDQVTSQFSITPEAVDTTKLSADIASLRTVLEDTKTKALAGDVQGTRDAEGKGDVAIEAIIDAIRPTEPALADSIETLELDYEGQADSDNPDLTVIAQDAQDVLDLLDQVASKFNITP